MAVRHDPSCLDRVEEKAPVVLRLIGVSDGELRDRFVEFASLADIRRYCHRIAGARVGACQGAAAEGGIKGQRRCESGPDVCQPLILQPPDIEKTPVERDLCPAEEDIGCSLQHVLPDNHTLAVIGIV